MNRSHDVSLFTVVDDELFDQLDELTGQAILYVEVWEDSLTDDLNAQEGNPTTKTCFDLDLYLQDGVYLELYGAQCFPDLDSEPWQDHEQVKSLLVMLIKRGLILEEIAVNEAEGLVLVLGRAGIPRLYLDVGGWLIEEWDELPDA